MKRLGAILGLLVFLAGMVAWPLVHQLDLAHGHGLCVHGPAHAPHADGHPAEPDSRDASGHDATHHASTCSICKLAQAPFQASGTGVALRACGKPDFLPVLALRELHLAPAFRLPFSCGPPA